jgi:hypothetical protein
MYIRVTQAKLKLGLVVLALAICYSQLRVSTMHSHRHWPAGIDPLTVQFHTVLPRRHPSQKMDGWWLVGWLVRSFDQITNKSL